MLRGLIIDSFAGGGGSDGGNLRSWLELDLFMPGEEHHSDLTSSAPHDVTKHVAINAVETKEHAIGWAFVRIDYDGRTRAFHVTHVAWKRSRSSIDPYSSTLHVRVGFNIYQIASPTI